MSSALGPIHYWIFNQVGLVEERGEALAEALAEELGEPAREAWRRIREEHPGRYSGAALEELVRERPIHSALESMIACVQAREADWVAWAGVNDVLDTLRRAYADDGSRWGARVRESAAPAEAPTIFSALRELWLEGMPCDVRIDIVESSPGRFRWTQPDANLARYWAGSGCPPQTMIELQGLWMAAFVKACADGFAWSMIASAEAGADRFEFEIAQR